MLAQRIKDALYAGYFGEKRQEGNGQDDGRICKGNRNKMEGWRELRIRWLSRVS